MWRFDSITACSRLRSVCSTDKINCCSGLKCVHNVLKKCLRHCGCQGGNEVTENTPDCARSKLGRTELVLVISVMLIMCLLYTFIAAFIKIREQLHCDEDRGQPNQAIHRFRESSQSTFGEEAGQSIAPVEPNNMTLLHTGDHHLPRHLLIINEHDLPPPYPGPLQEDYLPTYEEACQ